MQTNALTYKQLFSGLVAVGAVLAANLLAAEARIVRAPGAIENIAAPDIDMPATFDAADLVVPVLRDRDLMLPEPPAIDVEAVRDRARAWLGDGPIAAPNKEIEVSSPSLDSSVESLELELEAPELTRPDLPELPEIR